MIQWSDILIMEQIDTLSGFKVRLIYLRALPDGISVGTR
jgi:hypothetical protein